MTCSSGCVSMIRASTAISMFEDGSLHDNQPLRGLVLIPAGSGQDNRGLTIMQADSSWKALL